MDTCCSPGEAAAEPSHCAVCGTKGRRVELVTLKALLRPAALERLTTEDYYFCSSASCTVVYFGPRETFRTNDVLVPVFQKCMEGSRTVCYCLEIGEDEVRSEVEPGGGSASAERIKKLVENERCACELRNPQGSCCLGNVAVIVRSAQRLCVT